MARLRLVELIDNQFLYQCEDCGKEWPVMTTQRAKSSPPSHRCRRAALRIVQEAAGDANPLKVRVNP